MSERSKVEQAAEVVRGRLVETDGIKGLKILGRDALGNWRTESQSKREWDLRAKTEIPAQIIIAPIGQSFINQHPGFLRAIDKGNLSPQWTSEEGSSSLVVHPDKFPGVVIKYMRFSSSRTITEWQKPLMPGMSRDLSKNPDAIYHMTQVATGIDHFYWKQMIAKILEAKGMRAAKPFLATHDVLVEEHITGSNLLDFLRQAQQGYSEQEFKQLAESLTEITKPIYEKSLEMFREEAAKRETLPYQLPTTFDMSPPPQWKENPVKDGRVISHSSLANWIVMDEEGGAESLKNLSQVEQQQWFKDHLVLIDPFADFAYLTEEEVEVYKHSIPKTPKPTGQPEQTETIPATAEGTQEETKSDKAEQDTPPRKLTRRTALKALAGVLGTVALNKGWEKIIEIREEGSAEALRKQLEKQFNIDLSISRAYNTGHEVWNKNHLIILAQSLSLLPDHLYKPGKSGQKVNIWINQASSSYCVCGTMELDPLFPLLPKETQLNNVQIGAGKVDAVEDLLPVLAHELTHWYQLATWKKDSSNLPWYQRVEQTLGGRWDSELINRFMDKIKEKFPGISELRSDYPFGSHIRKKLGNTKEAFYTEFAFGLAVDINSRQIIPRDTPIEFVATLSQHYIEGKKYFFQAYTEFFPRETVEKLYNFVRDDIFRGREY